MKRVLAFVMMFGMLAGITACSENRDHRRNRDRESSRTELKVDVDTLRTYDGPMLEITSTIRMPVPDDVDPNSTSVLYYDGTVNI